MGSSPASGGTVSVNRTWSWFGGILAPLSESPAGAFRRAIDLPVPIDGEKVEAVHRNGVLTLRLPKAPEHRPRQISVKAG